MCGPSVRRAALLAAILLVPPTPVLAQSVAGSVNIRAIGGIPVSGADVIDPPTSAVRVVISTTSGLALDTSVNGLLLAQGSATVNQRGPLVQGAVTTFGSVYTHGQTSPLSLTLQGALRVDATATTQPVSGAVFATTPDVTGTPGILNALNATAQVGLSGHASVGAFIAPGSLSATLVPELSFDGGATWVATWFDQSNRTKLTTIVLSKPNAATSLPIVVMGGATHARVRVSTYTTGTAQATLTATTGFDLYALYTAPTGTLPPPTNISIGGITGGTTMTPLRTTSDGRLVVWSSNSVTEAAPYAITDGIRGPVAVSRSLQPASPADPALVVTLSPVTAFPAMTTKGVPPAQVLSTQPAVDQGRRRITFVVDAVAPAASETAVNFAVNAAGTNLTSQSSYTVSAGKIFRIQSVTASMIDSSTVANNISIHLRESPPPATGVQTACGATSTLVFSILLGTTGAGTIAANEGWSGLSVPIPDGMEFSQKDALCLSAIASATTATMSITIVGFEY